ncbi:MAG: ATP-binding protein [Opitutaceae bacterium]|nr:ATP-binding protein [Opitutaceae bacterium]
MSLEPSAARKPNRRILIIDDNRAIHDDFHKILGAGAAGASGLDDAEAALFGTENTKAVSLGFEVDSALQGKEGLERVQRALQEGRPYAMAFVDMRMPPGWDGVETIARIWEAYPDLQVVVCTAYSDYSWDEMMAKIGQSDRLLILKKPFDVVEVLQMANALVAKWDLLQQTRTHVDELEGRIRERTQALESANTALQTEIADRNKMEIQLRHAQKMESIGQLAAGIAHEINTPTQYIGDNTRFVQESCRDLLALVGRLAPLTAPDAAPPDAAWLAQFREQVARADLDYLAVEMPKAIAQSLDGVARVAKIVRAMKEFSHPGTAEKTPIDLNHAIDSTLTVATTEWKYVADLVTEFDASLPPVSCLPGEFNQVILNLVVNACHAITDVVGAGGTSKGTITISTRRDGEWVEVRVRDSGTGIPEPARARIFDPFFTTKGVGKGTGQGLAIAHAVIVEKHGGTIHFETEMGQGTTFIIRIPLQPAAIARQAA